MVPRILLPLIGMTLLAAVIMAEDVTESPCTSVDECNTCTNEQLKCIACSSREALLVDGSGCNDCSSNCAECVDEGTAGSPDIKCTECFVGYVLNAEKECTECSTGCQYCNTTSDSTVCHTCYEPNGLGKYYARNDVDGTCLQCPANCKTCSVQITDGVASTVCSDCIESYALNSDKVCKPCPANCVKCSVNGDGVTICSECSAPGYVLDKTEGANKCLDCDCGEVGLCNGEQRTTSFSKCSGCPDGKYLTTSGSCSSCTGGCKTCETSSANCLTCEDGTYAIGDLPGPCSGCVSNCEECKDGATCETCDESYGVSVSDLICEVCVDANCDFCEDDAAVCTSCEDGYYFDATAATKCTSCDDPNCKTCNGAANMCTVCNGNWKVWDNACVERDCADPVCTDCTADSAVCAACPEGYKIVMGKCEACDIMNCADCDASKTTCAVTKCKKGYGLIDNSGTITCEECTIAECTQCDGDIDQCEATFCTEGYTVASSVCAQCDVTNCADCDALKTTCATTKCKEGFGHIDDGMSMPNSITCQECTDMNCATCDTTLATCTACKKGYTVVDPGNDNTCEACSVNLVGCAECNAAASMCTKCQSDLVMNSAGTACYTCGVAGCTACSDNGECESTGCMAGYKYKSSDMSCVQCDVNCDKAASSSCTLESDGTTSCSLCNDGYILNTDTNACETCDENCGTSSGDCIYTSGEGVKCITCAAEYHSNGVTCDACPSGCATCPGELVCGTCIASRKENRDVCVRCPNDCEECSETDGVMICSKCADQFTLNSEGNECKACPGQCNKCAYSGGNVICQECQSGTGLSGNRQSCTACSTLTFADCATCTSADSNEVATCLSCRGSYTLRDDGNACTACSPLTDCSVCEDKPYECSSCKEGFSETEDHLCAHLCYTCEGNRESCGDFDFVGLSNSTEACFEGACVAVWDKTTDIHHRGCANVTCSPSNVERCDGDTCTRCCEGDKCNNWTLTGMSGATAISQTLAFVMVTLAALGLLK